MTGKVIVANYNDISTGQSKNGYFLVLYDEGCDRNTSGNENVVALKITSNMTVDCAYAIPIMHREFRKPSQLLCSKFYTINKKNIVATYTGVNDNYMGRVLYVMSEFFKEVKAQKERRIPVKNEFSWDD